eukprot:795047-Heterocapsa_arctica.AAC.1
MFGHQTIQEQYDMELNSSYPMDLEAVTDARSLFEACRGPPRPVRAPTQEGGDGRQSQASL